MVLYLVGLIMIDDLIGDEPWLPVDGLPFFGLPAWVRALMFFLATLPLAGLPDTAFITLLVSALSSGAL